MAVSLAMLNGVTAERLREPDLFLITLRTVSFMSTESARFFLRSVFSMVSEEYDCAVANIKGSQVFTMLVAKNDRKKHKTASYIPFESSS